jgi:hypothetical protein
MAKRRGTKEFGNFKAKPEHGISCLALCLVILGHRVSAGCLSALRHHSARSQTLRGRIQGSHWLLNQCHWRQGSSAENAMGGIQLLGGAAPSESSKNQQYHRRRLPTKATTNLYQTNSLPSIGDKHYFQAAKGTHSLLQGSFTHLFGRSACLVQRIRAHMRAVGDLIGHHSLYVAIGRFQCQVGETRL